MSEWNTVGRCELTATAIVGNAANQVMSTQDFLDEVYEVQTPYTELFHEYYGTEFPFWDETAMFSVLDTSNVLNSTTCKNKGFLACARRLTALIMNCSLPRR